MPDANAEISSTSKPFPSPDKNETILRQAFLMAEIGMDLKERYLSGEKYLTCLKTVLLGADKTIGSLKHIAKSSLTLSEKLLSSMSTFDDANGYFKNKSEKLRSLLEKQISDLEEGISELDLSSITQLTDKIKFFDSKQKLSEHNMSFHSSSSNKSVKVDVDEKYPENLSRESLIDLNNVANLPPVPEDIFTSFSSTNNKPMRSSSLSSLKSMRKVKLFLQKAENSDDEESSENEEHEFNRYYGDADDDRKLIRTFSSTKKTLLGNIKEESQD